jgi:hypothetical protein
VVFRVLWGVQAGEAVQVGEGQVEVEGEAQEVVVEEAEVVEGLLLLLLGVEVPLLLHQGFEVVF